MLSIIKQEKSSWFRFKFISENRVDFFLIFFFILMQFSPISCGAIIYFKSLFDSFIYFIINFSSSSHVLPKTIHLLLSMNSETILSWSLLRLGITLSYLKSPQMNTFLFPICSIRFFELSLETKTASNYLIAELKYDVRFLKKLFWKFPPTE